ncbi:aspartyl-phosphate phosphatase Spo0E family protein [Clostridium beijerinckii]|uniref:Spo0E like sporulation regulatory protein n=1 Tax=Clostridium beijerinckii TaxID=1520 RepID=A0AAE5H9K8_CLOBE|nr:aspartyl-phosphate phosphatase Spo0E family protein [Clostridium beijerinckii]NSB16489.1 hypothetical protein [Clostridium beijerinckii]OOM25694.1 Spo0E like sporulation regulatory protein [Clostridium beijerinckii]
MCKLDKDIEEAREQMHRSILENGNLAPKTIELSQELDRLIVEKQLKIIRCEAKC